MRQLFLFSLMAALVACGKAKVTDGVVGTQPQGKVGPFDLVLSGESDSKPNTFAVDVAQDEGRVDYYLQSGDQTQYLIFDSHGNTVRGCDAAKVKVTPLWYQTENLDTPQILLDGYALQTTPHTRARLTLVFQGLKGCSHVESTMVVRKLDVGTPQIGVENTVRGVWDYGTSPGLTINLSIGSSRVGWLESQAGNYTCDTSIYPSTAPQTGGGWMVTSAMYCRYQFTDADTMNFNCFGTPNYGCTLPKNFVFHRH